MNPVEFGRRVLEWFDAHGRKQLPWQENPRRTGFGCRKSCCSRPRSATVIPYYQRFMARFPDIRRWPPLNRMRYCASGRDWVTTPVPVTCTKRRASCATGMTGADYRWTARPYRNCRASADRRRGRFWLWPSGQRQADSGRQRQAPAGAIRGDEGWPGQSRVLATLWDLAERHTPAERVADYTQAMMDLGALVCTPRRPRCEMCPLAEACAARQQGRVAKLPSLQTATGLAGTNHSDAVAAHDDGKCCWSAGHRRAFGAGCGAFPNVLWRVISRTGAGSAWG
jgi:A/G-specific adenine glycosylase